MAEPGWRAVRVFISSTFRDMQAERDHLVRFVFPRLREELFKRRIHVVDVDLHWGVTSDQDALGVCREIIDECRPRFICILGGRYGTTPEGQPESITAAEVRYAALDRLKDREYRFFYFRDPQATAAMVEGKLHEFREPPGSDNERNLEVLKQEITDAGLNPFIYPASWDERESRLTGLRTFGDRVYSDLLWSIDDELGPEPPEPLDEFADENGAMEAFVESYVARYVVGSCVPLLDEMAEFAQSDGKPSVLAITSDPGLGKSALLARSYRDYATAHPNDLVIPHFIGASPGSTDLRRTLRRLCRELSTAAGIEEEVPRRCC